MEDSESDPPCDAGVGLRTVKDTLLAAVDEDDIGRETAMKVEGGQGGYVIPDSIPSNSPALWA